MSTNNSNRSEVTESSRSASFESASLRTGVVQGLYSDMHGSATAGTPAASTPESGTMSMPSVGQQDIFGRVTDTHATGPNGGSFDHGGFAAAGDDDGHIEGGAFQSNGAQGGSADGGHISGSKPGAGAFENSQLSAVGPDGSTYNGYTNGEYNAQTGTGTFNASHQWNDAQNGNNYGYTKNTTWTEGQGGESVITTDNHGTFDIQKTPG